MRVRKSIANAVLLDSYNRVNAEFMFKEYIGPPYAVCGMACMKDVCKWATKTKRQYEWPCCVFEDGDKHKKEFKELIARLKDWPNPIFEAKGRNFRSFEAADLVAWENRKLYTEAESGKFSKFRKSFSELQKISPTWFVYTENELRRLCATFEVPKRTFAASSIQKPAWVSCVLHDHGSTKAKNSQPAASYANEQNSRNVRA